MGRGSSAKGDARRLLRARRRELAAARDLAADGAALAAVLESALGGEPLAGLRSGATVLSYESLPHEPPTAALNARLQRLGLRVLVPITLPDMRLEWCDLADAGRTPLGTDAPAGADLALVPALAVDTTGTRLGQGGGCYDRVLPALPSSTPVLVLLHPGEHTGALLPRDPHDVPVRWVLTAGGLSPASEGSGPP
jgi:5-formyltetrahydrofolate cyclo-ligase